MKNWKTSAWGIIAIVSAVLDALVAWHSGQHLNLSSILSHVLTIAVGAGLISAADANPSALLSKLLGALARKNGAS